MKKYLDKNGWTVHITDLDPRNISDSEIEDLQTLPFSNILVVIHDVPKLTQEEYQIFAHKIYYKVENDSPNPERRFLDNSNREILRVSGQKNEKGEIIGLFAQPELLPWHSNQPGMPLDIRPDCLTLYSISGTEGSVTAYTNGIFALRDLRNTKDAPSGLVQALDQIDVYYEYDVDTDLFKDNIYHQGYRGRNKLVNKNKSGQEGIFIGNFQAKSFYYKDKLLTGKISDSWITYLKDFVVQEKYVYEHKWKDNQITLNCQILSQHARYPFPNIEKRLLWRIVGTVHPFDKPLQTNFPSWN